MKPCQIENESYQENFADNKRLPLLLRKHIEECEDPPKGGTWKDVDGAEDGIRYSAELLKMALRGEKWEGQNGVQGFLTTEVWKFKDKPEPARVDPMFRIKKSQLEDKNNSIKEWINRINNPNNWKNEI